jgi:alkylhydroperoxidase family enzyme
MPEKEQAALEFTRKLTLTPHKVGRADVELVTKHYSPAQVLEIVVTVAGYNSTNRWTDALNIPGEDSGERFTKPDVKLDLKTFKTPTSPKYADLVSSVAPLSNGSKAASSPAMPARPALESRAQVEAALKEAATRKPILPQADGTGPRWERLLNTFAKSSAGRITGLKAAAEKGLIPARLQGEIAWAAAREDRAWYALGLAQNRLKAAGMTDDQIFALDGDGKDLPEKERAVIAFARKLTSAPATVSDADVEGLRKLFSDKEVAEIVHHVCNAAFFNRVTETAQLPFD